MNRIMKMQIEMNALNGQEEVRDHGLRLVRAGDCPAESPELEAYVDFALRDELFYQFTIFGPDSDQQSSIIECSIFFKA